MVSISQIAIAVEDIDKAKGVFETLIGKPASQPHLVESQNVNVSFIEVGETKIELLEPAAPQTPITNFLEKRGGGIHHIGIKTNQFDEMIQKLKSMGVRTLGDPTVGAEGHRVIFFHPKDTFGVLIELEEASDE
ncbi:MAG: methylmalonyl-CoA epimerase [Methanobacteriota archaeon]|nr:MAG: methylmalonyl-CoA epimerase [Euryarchaeota archaeon]